MAVRAVPFFCFVMGAVRKNRLPAAGFLSIIVSDYVTVSIRKKRRGSGGNQTRDNGRYGVLVQPGQAFAGDGVWGKGPS